MSIKSTYHTHYTKNGKVIKLHRDIGETREQYEDRSNFVISQDISSPVKLDDMVLLSRVYRNVKYDNASYSTDLINKMKSLIENIFVE
jgi:hypothetical protein